MNKKKLALLKKMVKRKASIEEILKKVSPKTKVVRLA